MDKSNLKEEISEHSELDISIESDIDDTDGNEEQDTKRMEVRVPEKMLKRNSQSENIAELGGHHQGEGGKP